MTPEEFKRVLAEAGVPLSPEQEEAYAKYYQILVEWNQKMNLTGLTEEGDVYLKHFYDSLTLALETDLFKEPIHLCDVGAGAGFPSLPIKIAFPHIQVTIVDSLQKRIGFLNHLVDSLQLEGVNCYHDRAESFGQNPAFREQFDLVTARAVARLNLLSEFCLPLVKLGGHFAAMKATDKDQETQEAQKAIQVLGGKLVSDLTLDLPQEAGQRHIVLIAKTSSTPKKYPRKAGLPAKNPIR